MKIITVVCPNCNHIIYYKNWFIWVLRTPFHWFSRRRFKCPICYEKAYVAPISSVDWQKIK